MCHFLADHQQSSESRMAFKGVQRSINFITVVSEIGARYKKKCSTNKARIAKMFKLCEFVFSAFG